MKRANISPGNEDGALLVLQVLSGGSLLRLYISGPHKSNGAVGQSIGVLAS